LFNVVSKIEIVDPTSATDERNENDLETIKNSESSRVSRKMTPKRKEIEKSDYKKPKVASRLADYIKQPIPELSEEEKLERAKIRKSKFQLHVIFIPFISCRSRIYNLNINLRNI
jgi:hypothetical protein